MNSLDTKAEMAWEFLPDMQLGVEEPPVLIIIQINY